MKTQTFTGATSREVLQKVKQALGDDALILSNRACAEGIEVVALAASGMMSEPVAAFAPAAPAAAAPAPESTFEALAARVAPPATALSAPAAPEPVSARELIRGAFAHASAAPSLAPAQPAQPAHVAAPAEPRHAAADIDGILSEIQSLKTILRNDIAAFAAVESAPAAPAPSDLTQDLLQTGFSLQLARRLAGHAGAAGGEASTIDEVAERLADELPLAAEDEIISTGGVYALVGPTGAGKTTTVAKLAARAVVRYGASKVALLTTDAYRIGAHDQLRIYGRILSVPVHTVSGADDLAHVLAELSGRHLILIDTIGMSPRDRMVAEQTAILAASGKVKRILLVSATANTATLNQVVAAYKSTGIHGCILTKTDEAANLAPSLDVVIRHALPLHYVTDGQRVPEDLQLPDTAALVTEALRAPDDDLDPWAHALPMLEETAASVEAAAVTGRRPGSDAAFMTPMSTAATFQPVARVVHG